MKILRLSSIMKIFVLLSVFWTPDADADDPIFGAKTDYPVVSWSRSVFSIDLDGDGDNDLAATNGSSNNVSVLFNNGDGTFQEPVNYDVGVMPYSIFSVDLDNDGDNDLATANHNDNDINLTILLNNGSGVFDTSIPHVCCGVFSTSIFAADLNDVVGNELAIVGGSPSIANVSTLENSGGGLFVVFGEYPIAANPKSVFSIDLNGDNVNDLVTAHEGGEVIILLNFGDGTFYFNAIYSAAIGANSVFSIDFDDDADNDLAVASDETGTNNLSIFMNNGDGTFQSAVQYDAGDAPYSVFSTDFDGDADNDLAVADRAGNASILLNNGDGTFQSADLYYTGGSPLSVFSCDIDGDGDNDLALSNMDGYISILLNLTGPYYICGDANSDQTVNIGDAVYLINYIFKGGPAPDPLESGDASCDGAVNIGDAVYLINYIFKGGPEPCCP